MSIEDDVPDEELRDLERELERIGKTERAIIEQAKRSVTDEDRERVRASFLQRNIRPKPSPWRRVTLLVPLAAALLIAVFWMFDPFGTFSQKDPRGNGLLQGKSDRIRALSPSGTVAGPIDRLTWQGELTPQEFFSVEILTAEGETFLLRENLRSTELLLTEHERTELPVTFEWLVTLHSRSSGVLAVVSASVERKE